MQMLVAMSRSKERWWLLAIVAVGFALRAVTVTVLDSQPESDYLAYRTMALNLIAGRGIVDPAGNLAMMNMGYPTFVLAPMFALFHGSLRAAQLANSVLGAVSVALVWAVAREADAGHVGRLVAAAFWALYLPSWVYAEYLAKENLMIPLMLAILWCALRLRKKISGGIALLCGGLFGLIALAGNSGLSLGLAVGAAFLWAPGSVNRKLQAVVVMLAAAAGIVAPWIIRNQHAIGAAVLNTNGGFNLYLGNNPAATGLFVSIADTPRGSTWHALRKEQGEARASDTLRGEALQWMREHPGTFILLSLKRAALFWMLPMHENESPQSKVETLSRWLWLVQFAVLAVAAAGGVLVSSLRRRDVALLWLAILGYTAAHMLFLVSHRYREPLMPFLCVLAALTIEALLARLLLLKPSPIAVIGTDQ
jgi:dolichyl-phosphate-mannose-protein mannosyltransferase